MLVWYLEIDIFKKPLPTESKEKEDTKFLVDQILFDKISNSSWKPGRHYYIRPAVLRGNERRVVNHLLPLHSAFHALGAPLHVSQISLSVYITTCVDYAINKTCEISLFSGKNEICWYFIGMSLWYKVYQNTLKICYAKEN